MTVVLGYVPGDLGTAEARLTVGKLLLGSTAQRVLLESPCDVLAVRLRR